MDYALEMLQEQRDSASKERAAQIVAAVKTLHVDEMSIGTKVSFVKKFSGSKEYTYLALKTRDTVDGVNTDRWYITGKSGKYTNEQFENLLAEKLGFEDFQVLVPMQAVLTATSNWIAPPASYVSPKKVENEHVEQLKGWGADVNPAPSTHAFGPEMPGEEDPK